MGGKTEIFPTNKCRFVTSTEVTKLVIHRGAIGPELNNQLSYRFMIEEVDIRCYLTKNSILDVVLEQ